MQPIIMQPWLTLRGSGVTVIQDAAEWLPTGPFQDMFFSIDVRELSIPATVTIETSPNRDDLLFQPAVTAFTPSIGNNYKQVLLSNNSVLAPISAWTRWKVVFGTGADIAFRIIANGNRFC